MTAALSNRSLSNRRSIRRNLLGGMTIVALLVGGMGVWAGTVDISGAVISRGAVVVDSSEKKVQHPTGGVVGKIFVRDGDRVRAGDILVQLSDTVPRASLAYVTKNLDELYARKSRLEAERDGSDRMTLAPVLAAGMNDPEIAATVASEQRLFELRRTEVSGNKARLRERIEQLGKQIEGYSAQESAKTKEIELINDELADIRSLVEMRLTLKSKLTEYEREATRIAGERAQLLSSMAQAKGAIAEIEIQILQLDKEFASETGSELREVEAKIAEFEEKKVTAEDQLSHIDIRAPASGTVHQSSIHTVGGVIGAGEPIMLIVPDTDALAVEVKAAPQDIDQLLIGQRALLRFTAFNVRTTPETEGVVSMIAADVTRDQHTNEIYYAVRITPDPKDFKRLGPVSLIPGMPVEAFIRTGDRKVLSYLMKPLTDQMMRAFRDQ
ncbi:MULTISPECIES: HlyD family type I secretion periplasmic adaptor subunit [unclassified Mesorhizobium]|uniref:HlyD family type I secretion periplasmic adaptor subunit n=1 Tax=unclassified Mesorhizobium TaxID=325217 RepID=UPI000FCBD899|nr:MULTISPECIES: HlyD family type I secretion periplasmic adaptor subunit [unclassified Mesorhizobium]TIT80786.1 MAG: HlyD family type I secretion periplasmic adaptor subunit [Mesorhizobium sp.]TGP22992.1 HlyD family type I secretion periplasmic adaptor subunit [Mesorhizobium sp. M1D.F.Ca.ET.231.01.1.1]TGP32054.1 HlyD family type I secretion periplasmic adaptor subunit [Mesorhizobium sp. M1D.F.Ca.ET.234.01.1.1]TGS46517.1 HlyD family type I secretion periplasmic adaptor subunit [Mesorhizobium sp